MANRCLYHNTFTDFVRMEPEHILGHIISDYNGTTQTTQNDAWLQEISLLQDVLRSCADEVAEIIFEYDIPRLGKRIDVERNEETQKYMLNAYRVLLTRARQGIVICVPYGNSKKTTAGFPEDPTRLPEFYDGIYKYFKNLGMQEI